MKKLLIISILSAGISAVYAQDYESDAAHMMRHDLGGTARSLGVGGAFSTVGADMSSMTTNPAGIALYRSHEIAISGGAIFGGTDSRYNTGSTNEQQSKNFSKATFSQAGIVLATKKLSRYNDLSFNRGGSKLDRFVFALGYQKLVDFNRNDIFTGTNAASSYAQALSNNLNANNNPITFDNFDIPTVQAYQAYAVDYRDSSGLLYPKIVQPVRQAAIINTKGALSDINMTLGFNIANTVYIGAGVGVPYMNYNRNASFTESTAAGDSAYSSIYNYSLSGFGVNGKFGIIVKPAPWVRLGASVQTPTYFRLDESTAGVTNSAFHDSTYTSGDQNSIYRFTYYNPLKATLGASFYIKQWAFISVDYEMNDYTHTHYSFDGAGSDAAYWNNLLESKYKLSSTVKAGAEFAYKTLRVRAGFAWMESPFKSNVAVAGYDGSRFNYTAGIGYRGKRFFADLAYVRTEYKDYYTPYSYTDANGSIQEPGVYNNFHSNMIILTIGLKFGLNRN